MQEKLTSDEQVPRSRNSVSTHQTPSENSISENSVTTLSGNYATNASPHLNPVPSLCQSVTTAPPLKSLGKLCDYPTPQTETSVCDYTHPHHYLSQLCDYPR
jgi:hypothetical protein